MMCVSNPRKPQPAVFHPAVLEGVPEGVHPADTVVDRRRVDHPRLAGRAVDGKLALRRVRVGLVEDLVRRRRRRAERAARRGQHVGLDAVAHVQVKRPVREHRDVVQSVAVDVEDPQLLQVALVGGHTVLDGEHAGREAVAGRIVVERVDGDGPRIVAPALQQVGLAVEVPVDGAVGRAGEVGRIEGRGQHEALPGVQREPWLLVGAGERIVAEEDVHQPVAVEVSEEGRHRLVGAARTDRRGHPGDPERVQQVRQGGHRNEMLRAIVAVRGIGKRRRSRRRR